MARVSRTIIGFFGRVNAGKSTAMNLLTRQPTSLVDAAPGTTADVRDALMEIHALGPCKILDTAGLDEGAGLGEKKRQKTLAALEECDLVALVVDPRQAFLSGRRDVEAFVAREALRLGKNLAVLLNLRADDAPPAAVRDFCLAVLPPDAGIPVLEIDLADDARAGALSEFLAAASPAAARATTLLPFLQDRGVVLLHIPMDEETPSGRLLRPQEMAMESLLRRGVPVALYRTDLHRARHRGSDERAAERGRFVAFLDALAAAEGVQLVLTDSQAVDVMDAWVPADIPLTTFSVMMIHATSGGDLSLFARGAGALDALRAGDRVLIAEACNHDRIAEDIGTVQLPRKLKERVPGIVIEHAFGGVFPAPEELRRYAVVIHCGGCMIHEQKLRARVLRLAAAGVPVTNYGLALAWYEGPDALRRVLAPWRG
ncbi:MAG: 50S ribosome-binding GTPase [bacterium]|nr:50S ribosome-binding GTPase [bacterium]